MPKLNGRIPAYRRHKASGQAVVTLDGRDHYRGPYGTPASRAEYDRLVTVWLARGRRLPPPPLRPRLMPRPPSPCPPRHRSPPQPPPPRPLTCRPRPVKRL